MDRAAIVGIVLGSLSFYIGGALLTLWLQKQVYGKNSSSWRNDEAVFSFLLWPIVFLWVGPVFCAKKIGRN